jgi:hypothetical protein
MRRAFFLLVSVVLGCGAQVDPSSNALSSRVVSEAPDPGSPDPGGSTAARPEDGTTHVLARITDGDVHSMLVDETTLYFGGYGVIRKIPKEGGAITTLCAVDPSEGSATLGMAMDDAFIYFSENGRRRISRVPKAGGTRETIVEGADYPSEIALDATHLYAAYEGAIVRVPKGGGAVEVLAAEQHLPGSIALHGADVYFDNAATDYQHGTDGTINAVAKSGGTVRTLARTVYGTAWHIVIADGSIFYVDQRTSSLARIPLAGGEPTIVVGSSLESSILADGATVFGFGLAVDTTEASVVRLDPSAKTSTTLATWTVPYPKATMIYPGARWSHAAVASTADAATIYWADYHNDSLADRGYTLRSTPRH